MTVIRKNIRHLSGPEMDNLVRAFHAIQNLAPDHPDSFYNLAGYHGEPFRGAGWGNSQWWGGYCNHGNVLFPTWHRAYLRRLELALQTQVPGVALPYWNEVEDATVGLNGEGIPAVFLMPDYHFSDNSGSIPNPLFSYIFQRRITDNLGPSFPDADYSKPKGYATVRFPFSGLVMGSDQVQAMTQFHNAKMKALGKPKTDTMLNNNVKMWLNDLTFRTSTGEQVAAGVKQRYLDALNAPNYTAFSNTTSAKAWNDEHGDDEGFTTAMSLESPHNAIHLAVGGIEIPSYNRNTTEGAGANGDMGENDTAAFDPIFFFHHCFIDLMFWKWQLAHNATDKLEIIAGFPGTNSVDGQGPTPGVPGGTWLTLDSALDPFPNFNDNSRKLTSHDVVNIRTQLGYNYDIPDGRLLGPQPKEPAPVLSVGGIDRGTISGSFVVSAWAVDNHGPRLVGVEPVLSRWRVSGCRNCQNHLETGAHFQLDGWTREEAETTRFEAKVHTHGLDGRLRNGNGDGNGLPEEEQPAVKLRTAHLA